MTQTRLAIKVGTIAALTVGSLIAGQAHALNPCFLSSLPGNANACDFSGLDFSVSNVTVSGFTPASFDTLGYTLSGNDLQPQLTFNTGRTAAVSGALTYTIQLLNGRKFSTAQANITGNNGNFSTSTSSPGLTSDATSAGGPGSTVNFIPNLTSLTFTQTFSSTANGSLVLNSLGTIYSTTSPETATTPGPLPLLGAGAAFGFSRRLRNRVKASA